MTQTTFTINRTKVYDRLEQIEEKLDKLYRLYNSAPRHNNPHLTAIINLEHEREMLETMYQASLRKP